MKLLFLSFITVVSPLSCLGQANCFAHTSAYNAHQGFAAGSGAIISPPMNTTGATLLVAFVASTSGYNNTLNDSVGTTQWATSTQFGQGAGNNIMLLYKVAPVTSTNYTFSIPDTSTSGANIYYMAATMYACSGTATDVYALISQNGIDTSTATTWQPGTVGPHEAGDLVFTVSTPNTGSDSVASIDSGFPAPFAYAPSGPYAHVYTSWLSTASNAALNPTWTGSSSGWISMNAVFRAAGASAPTSSGRVINTVAFSGFQGLGGMGGPALNASVFYTGEIAKLSDGLICTAAVNNNVIVCYNPTGSTVTPPFLGSPAIAAGNVDIVAGTGAMGFTDNVPPLQALMGHPVGLTSDSHDCLYIADQQNSAIRKMCPGGNMTTIIGRGTHTGNQSAGCTTVGVTDGWNGFGGDGGPATAALIDCPQSVALDSRGNIAFGDYNNNRVRVVNTQSTTQNIAGVSVCAGCIQTVLGSGPEACVNAATGITSYQNRPLGVDFDSNNNLIVGALYCNQILKVDSSNRVIVLAGNGTQGWSGDGGPAVNAQLTYPFRANVDRTNNDLYIADTSNNLIRYVNHLTGIITTIAGNYNVYPPRLNSPLWAGAAFCCDTGWANLAALGYPIGLYLDRPNNLIYVSDLFNQRIRTLSGAFPVPASATCFAHTTVQLGSPNVSAPINDTGANMLIAFITATGFGMIRDVAGGPNVWYQVGNWGIGNTFMVNILVAPNPITSTAATFKNASGSNGVGSAQIWACSGVNASDLFYSASGPLHGSNSASISPPIGAADTTIPLRLIPAQPIKNGDYGFIGKAPTEYMLVTDASLGQTQPGSIVVQRGQLGTTAQAWGDNQAMAIGQGVAIKSCSPPASLVPSAVGDLEFVIAGRPGTGAPNNSNTTATIDTAGFAAPVASGGAATGTAGTIVTSWRVATDMSPFQPTLTMSASDQWQCASIVIKASTSPSSPEPPPLIHTAVGNGYQCNSPGAAGSDCPAPAPGDGGDPKLATLNWPSELLWYHHNVPVDKVMVFVDNQADLVRAVNFDTVPHTVANVVIQPNTIQRIAGTGNQAIGNADGGCTGNNGPALSATIIHPASIAEDPTTGNIAIGDQQCASFDVITTTGNFYWAAGGGPGGTLAPGGQCGVQTRHGDHINVPATQALLGCAQGNDYDASGNLIGNDISNNRLVFVNNQSTPVSAYGVTGIQPGYVVKIAGTGLQGCTASYTPQPALNVNFTPMSVQVVRSTGDIIVGSIQCQQIYKVTANGNIVLLAGIDRNPPPYNGGYPTAIGTLGFGYSPDGTPANGASLYYPFRATLEADGLIHFTDTGGNSLRHIDANGKFVTDIGNFSRWGPKYSYMGGGWYGEGGSASRYELNYPIGYAYDSQGNVCVGSTMSDVISCTTGGVAPSIAGGAFIATKAKWTGKTFIAGAGGGAPQPIYGGAGQPGATSAFLSGSTVVINDSANSVLAQIKTTPEQVGDSWSFVLNNQCVYLILFGSSHNFVDGNGHAFAFNSPTAVTVGGVSMFMYQSSNPLVGNFTVKVAP